MGAETKARWCPGRYVPRVFWSLSRARDIRVAVRKADLRRLVELGVLAARSSLFRSSEPRTGVRSSLLRSSGPVGRSSPFRSSEPRGWLRSCPVRSSDPVGRSSPFRSSEPRGLELDCWLRSCPFRSSDLVGRSSPFRSSEPRGWVGVILGFSLAVASLLVKSSKPMDFLECCLWLRHCSNLFERCLRFRYSEPRDVGVARLSSIPLPAMSLLYRSSKPLDFRLVT